MFNVVFTFTDLPAAREFLNDRTAEGWTGVVVDESTGEEVEETRYAVVRLARNRTEVEAYLPDNYRVVSSHLGEPVAGGRVHVVIAGIDRAGWTLDGYVLPRLASGNLHGREYPSFAEASEAAAASMN